MKVVEALFDYLIKPMKITKTLLSPFQEFYLDEIKIEPSCVNVTKSTASSTFLKWIDFMFVQNEATHNLARKRTAMADNSCLKV